MEETKPVVNEEVTEPEVSEDSQTQEQEVVETEESTSEPAPQGGDKTDPNLLLKAVQTERDLRKEAERLLEEERKARSSDSSEEVVSDEGKVLADKIADLEGRLSGVAKDSEKGKILSEFSVLTDKWEAFEEYANLSDNKGMSLKTAARAFIIENGLSTPARKGLEKPTGGDRAPSPSGMTAEEMKNLRETQPKRYYKLLTEDKLPRLKE